MQRRSVLLGLAGLPLAATAKAATLDSDVIQTSAGEVTLTPVLHASLVIGFGAQTIYVDPVGGDFSALPPPTAIFITHGHGDHYDIPTLERIDSKKATIRTNVEVAGWLPRAVQPRAQALKNGESGEINGIPVEAVAAYNITKGRTSYHPQGVGNGYLFTFGDTRIYVTGDTEPTPEMLALRDIDVAFLPMMLPYTMSMEQAAEAVKGFGPKIVYPYHYDIADPADFAALVGNAAEVRLRDWYMRGHP